MSPRQYFQLGSIPVCAAGAGLSAATPGGEFLAIPFFLLACAFTLALIWER